jgi:hypothetical protein
MPKNVGHDYFKKKKWLALRHWISKVRVMVFNTTFNNILVTSWASVLLLEETKYPEKTTDLSQVIDKLYHIPVSPELDSNSH